MKNAEEMLEDILMLTTKMENPKETIAIIQVEAVYDKSWIRNFKECSFPGVSTNI